MKLSKKEIKRIEKNKRRVNELNLISIKDEMHKTSALDKTLYLGCEIIQKRSLPNFLNHLIREMKMNNPIKVPQRKNGMTSSGKENYCHSNVESLVRRYGGKRMVGYLIQIECIGTITFISHSVWKTPEGKLVDVTKKTHSQKEILINPNEDFTYFIPVKEGSIVLKDFATKNDYRRFGFLSGAFPEPMKIQRWNNPTIKNLVSNKKEEYFYGKNWINHSYFSIPSTTNGKYFSELRSS